MENGPYDLQREKNALRPNMTDVAFACYNLLAAYVNGPPCSPGDIPVAGKSNTGIALASLATSHVDYVAQDDTGQLKICSHGPNT